MESAAFQGEAVLAEGGVLTGAGPLLRFFEQAAAGAGAECLAVLPVGGRRLVAPEAARPLLQLMANRGVDVKVMYPVAARLDPGIRGFAQWVVGLGVAVRATATPPPTMVIFDRRLVLLPLAQEDRTRGAAQVTDPAVVGTLAWLFDEAWRQADPLCEQGPETDVGPFTEIERRLLLLLADGETDESAARRLAMSVRSERRIMASLMERLGAVSRFQAGHRATLRGWL